MADPLSVEAQEEMFNRVKQANIQHNMEQAIEFNPESFGSVVMLYVNSKVNGVDVKAFVDSGAQTTIMSRKTAERCNILHLMDTRFQGIAQGVGTSKILGKRFYIRYSGLCSSGSCHHRREDSHDGLAIGVCFC